MYVLISINQFFQELIMPAVTTEVFDYVSVHQRSIELGCVAPRGVCLLPVNFDKAADRSDFVQRSEADTVRTLFRINKVPFDDLLTEGQQSKYLQNNAFEWAAPVLFISAGVISENPAVVSTALGVLANYVTDFFRGIAGEKKVTLDVIVEMKGDRRCKRLHYEGDSAGLTELPPIIKRLSDE